ncbi:MAG: hypothetical protein ABR915_22600, partial [Thermoguttaceae bacterium]
AFDVLQTVAGNGGAEQDRLAGKAFSEILGAAADVKLLSLTEWRAQSEGLIAQVAATPTLFIFDDDFRLEGGKQDDGRRLIDQVHQRLGQYRYAYALLTHNATTDESEIALERIIARDYPAIADYVVVIAKTRLTGEGRERFVHRLKGTLLFRLFRVLRSKLKEAALAAHNEAIDKIDSFGVDAFERIIYRSSREEGAWSPETLMRIFEAVQERGVRSRLRLDEELHKAIWEIDPLCAIETGGISKHVEKTAEELQRAEVYDTAADLNLLHLPVDFGDIFRSDSGDQYVVVAQPCDLMVRKDGRRKKDLRDERQMLTLLPVGSRAKSKKGPRVQEHEFELCHFAEGAEDVWFSQVNQALYVPAWILDMAVLNPEGACSIDLGQQAPPLLTLPWRQRLDIVKGRAAKVIELADAAAIPAGENREELLRSLLRLPLTIPFSVRIDPPNRRAGQLEQLHVGLRRVIRLRQGYAAALLSQYANYMSRLDQPHDLTRLG